MAASFSTLVVLVLLYRVGQAANHARIHEPVQNDGTSKDARLNEMTLEKFSWTYRASDGETSLTVCTAEPFVGLGQTVKQVTLLTTTSDGTLNNCQGVFDENGKKCATFTGPDICAVDIPSGHVQYTLNVDVGVVPFAEVNKIGTASFTMTVEAATLTCGSSKFIRATGTTNTVIAECVALGVDGVCYKMGDMFVDPLCFTVSDSDPAGLTLCLEGDNHVLATTDGELAITQLAYTPVGAATFALTHLHSALVGFDAIVLKEQAAVHSCAVAPVADSGTCIVTAFTGGHAEYEVCTILPTAGGFQTAVSSITDLNVQAGEDDSFLQFRFTNANPEMKYVAKFINGPTVDPPSVIIDCTGIPQDHICYGFLDKSISETFLAIEYLADDGTTSNVIAIPNPGIPIL